MSIKFSIAIPAFKGEYLSECIKSVLAQSYQNLECIIVNDNSPEDLDTILASFNDPRIVYSKNEQGYGAMNVSNNWNKCLEFATGDYFMCIGDDDRLLPDCLLQYEALIKKYPDRKIYHARTQIIDKNGDVYSLQEARPETESAYSMIWHKWCVGRKSYIGDYLFETQSLVDNGGFIWFPYAWGTEEATVYHQALFAGIANMSSFGFQYRCHPRTISADIHNLTGKADSFILFRKWFEDFLKTPHPLDNMDNLYYSLIKKRFNSLFEESVLMIIRDDVKYNHLKNLNHWRKHKEEYMLNTRQLLKAMFIGLRQSII